MKILALTLLILSSAWAHPDLETEMATITSNIDSDVGKFYLLTDPSGDVDAIRHTITQRSGRITEDTVHTWERIRDGGVVLVYREGREILRLHVDQNFSPKTGGVVRINYLFSGITNVRRDFNLALIREGSAFSLKKDTATVNSLYVAGNWNVLLGWIGISYITASFSPLEAPPYAHDSSPQ